MNKMEQSTNRSIDLIAEMQVRTLAREAKYAFRTYEDSGRKDKEALARADEKYAAYRTLFQALPEQQQNLLGLMRLPIDDITYLWQKTK